MKRTAFLVLFAMLAACNVQTKDPSKSDDKVSINADESGHIAFNLPMAEGQLKVPTSVMREGNFDIDGVRLMPGSSVTGFSVFAADKGSTVNMAFKAPAAPGEVRSYFVEQFKEKGVQAAAAGDAITGKTRDGDSFAIRVAPAAQGSTGTIAIQSQEDR